MADALAGRIEELHEAAFAWAIACCAWDRAEAEDVLQTVYLKLLDGRARFDERSSLRTFVFAVIRRTAADRRRRAWFSRLLSARMRREPEPAPVEPADLDRRRVRAALAELPQRQREVIDLVFYHDLTVEEAARVMSVSVGSARVHYDRGKRRLAEKLG